MREYTLAEYEEMGVIVSLICPGCGGERAPDKWAIHPTKVNKRDGSTGDILFCDQPCCDFWDESKPGDWLSLDSGEEVQLTYWTCPCCDSVNDWQWMLTVLDMDNETPEETHICPSCLRKYPLTYKLKEVEAK